MRIAPSSVTAVRRLWRELLFALALRALPRQVAAFQWRARRLASRSGDKFSLISATKPAKLATVLRLAAGRRHVVELGTATGWTAISLVLADPGRVVTSYDPVQRPELHAYLALIGTDARRRLRFVRAPGERGPERGDPVDLLYVDSSHSRQGTVQEMAAWRPALREDALVVFDDYGHPDFPGVREAVDELMLSGEERDGLFVHAVTTTTARPDNGGRSTARTRSRQ